MLIYCAIAVAAYFFYKWVTANNDYFEKRGIPFHKPVFLLGSNSNIIWNKMSLPDIVQKWYYERRPEKVSGMFEFRRPIYFIRDPKLVKKLAVKDFDFFTDHRSVIDESIDKLFGKSLVSLRGQKWRDMRTTLSPMFTGSKMRMMYDYVANVGQQTAKTMKEQIQSGSDNVFEFKTLAMKFTVDVIATCAFGIEVNSFKNPDNDFHKIATEATNFGNFVTTLKFIGYIIAKPLMKALNISLFSKDMELFFKEAILETMKIREEKGIVRFDMINLLMQAKKGQLKHTTKEEEKITEGFATVEEVDGGQNQVKSIFDDDDLAAQAFIFFFAGFDTVATTMSFIAHELTVNPEVQQKLFEEVQSMHEELNGKVINYEQIQGLKYLDQVVSETLRKWPAAPITDRLCVKDFDVQYEDMKFKIDKDCSFVIPIFSFHRDPEYFPDPLKFDPERFSDENRSKIDPDTYLPFGIGPRNCIGSRFALMELKTVIYYLLLNFSFEVTQKTQNPLKFDKNPIGLKTEKGIWVALKPRD